MCTVTHDFTLDTVGSVCRYFPTAGNLKLHVRISVMMRQSIICGFFNQSHTLIYLPDNTGRSETNHVTESSRSPGSCARYLNPGSARSSDVLLSRMCLNFRRGKVAFVGNNFIHSQDLVKVNVACKSR